MLTTEPPWYFWLAALPSYGMPLYVVFWTIRAWRPDRRKALKGLGAGLAAYLALMILFLVAGFMLEPCLENCSRFRTPEGNARMFALIVIYTLMAFVIVFRLHKYGKTPDQRGR